MRVKGSPRFEDAVDLVQQLAHDGDDDQLTGFVLGFESLGKCATSGVPARGHDGRHIEPRS